MLVVRRGKAPVIVAELPEERAPAKVASEPPALKMVHHPARETAATKEAAMGDQPAPLAPALKVGAMEQGEDTQIHHWVVRTPPLPDAPPPIHHTTSVHH